ncbi:MAG: hypothetical protein EBZ69_05000, partial [Alphaproteobacteria bacterium]|nr:hypothetical protein [Alphaproteobacteria bacterium]
MANPVAPQPEAGPEQRVGRTSWLSRIPLKLTASVSVGALTAAGSSVPHQMVRYGQDVLRNSWREVNDLYIDYLPRVLGEWAAAKYSLTTALDVVAVALLALPVASLVLSAGMLALSPVLRVVRKILGKEQPQKRSNHFLGTALLCGVVAGAALGASQFGVLGEAAQTQGKVVIDALITPSTYTQIVGTVWNAVAGAAADAGFNSATTSLRLAVGVGVAAMTWGVMWALQKGHHYFVKPFADAGRILTLPVAYGYRKITGKPWPGFFASPFANDVMMVGATAAAAFAYFNRYNPLRVPENVLINHSSTAWWSVTLGAPALAAYFLHKRGDVARMFNNTAKVVMARLPSRERVGALAQSDSLRTTFKNHPMLVASAAAGA